MKNAGTTRRNFLQHSAAISAGILGAGAALAGDIVKPETSPIDIGSRRELFVDDFLIENPGGVELKLHKPEARDVVISCDLPWEGNTSAYYTLFQDDDRYRMYYRGAHFDVKTKRESHPQFTCYAESRDGLAWEKPKLGLFEFMGSTQNNIIHTGDGSHNFTPFKDANPAAAAGARYKALAGGTTLVGGKKKSCLYAYQSGDGVRWARMAEEAVITAGAFDSQNLAFWDSVRGQYRAYWRIFSGGVRAIRTAVSKDFLHWENQADLRFVDSPAEHLYTNAIRPYFRAPHLFVGFPTRFQPAHQQVEPVFMTSRDGVLFRRWSEAIIPITAPKDRDGNRSNYMTNALLQLPGNDKELSVYATEAYYAGPGSRVRRFVYRMDGFVSASGGAEGAALLTRPLTFSGAVLRLNIVSRRTARVELQEASGKPLSGFALNDCVPITGDFIEKSVSWKTNDVSSLAGRAVRMKIELKDADLYAFQFGR